MQNEFTGNPARQFPQFSFSAADRAVWRYVSVRFHEGQQVVVDQYYPGPGDLFLTLLMPVSFRTEIDYFATHYSESLLEIVFDDAAPPPYEPTLFQFVRRVGTRPAKGPVPPPPDVQQG